MRALSELSDRPLFRYTNLLDMKGASLLLNACANILETLRAHTTARIRRWCFILARSHLSDSVIRRISWTYYRTLICRTPGRFRTLELTATSLPQEYSYDALRNLLSTITSPVFSEAVTVPEDRDILKCPIQGSSGHVRGQAIPFSFLPGSLGR